MHLAAQHGADGYTRALLEHGANPLLRTREIKLYCHGTHEVVQMEPKEIEWAAGKDPTVHTVTKRRKKGRGGEGRTREVAR